MAKAPATYGSPYPEPRDTERLILSGEKFIDGDAATPSLTMRQAKKPIIEKCEIRNPKGTAVRMLRGAWESSWWHCNFSGEVGMVMTGTQNNVHCDSCEFGTLKEPQFAVLMFENYLEPNKGAGVTNVTFTRCKFNAQVCVRSHPGRPIRNVVFRDCQIEQCWWPPFTFYGPWEHWTLSGGYILKPQGPGRVLIDVRHPGGPLILDGVRISVPEGYVGVSVPKGVEVVERNVDWRGKGTRIEVRK